MSYLHKVLLQFVTWRSRFNLFIVSILTYLTILYIRSSIVNSYLNQFGTFLLDWSSNLLTFPSMTVIINTKEAITVAGDGNTQMVYLTKAL